MKRLTCVLNLIPLFVGPNSPAKQFQEILDWWGKSKVIDARQTNS